MATQHDIFYSMDRAYSQLCVSFQVKINTTKLQMSPSLYLECIHVVPQRCCGGCTRGFAIPGEKYNCNLEGMSIYSHCLCIHT